MQKLNVPRTLAAPAMMGVGRPTMPVIGRQPVVERKVFDPSSSYPKGERYPIPAFFEYRIKARDFDPL